MNERRVSASGKPGIVRHWFCIPTTRTDRHRNRLLDAFVPSVIMSKYAPHGPRSANRPKATQATVCQKCLGHGMLRVFKEYLGFS